jgi:O-antigen/teichoic acid export membrane protein
VHFGIGISERTKYYSYVTWVAVAVVMALYALLIPPLGGLGAALATLAAFAVRFWVGYYWSQRLWPVDYRWSKNLWLATFGAGAITAAYAIRIQGTTEQLAFGGFLFAMYALLAWFLVVEPSDRALVWGLARQPSRLSSIFRP